MSGVSAELTRCRRGMRFPQRIKTVCHSIASFQRAL